MARNASTSTTWSTMPTTKYATRLYAFLAYIDEYHRKNPATNAQTRAHNKPKKTTTWMRSMTMTTRRTTLTMAKEMITTTLEEVVVEMKEGAVRVTRSYVCLIAGLSFSICNNRLRLRLSSIPVHCITCMLTVLPQFQHLARHSSFRSAMNLTVNHNHSMNGIRFMYVACLTSL